jgi:hypothetical protein
MFPQLKQQAINALSAVQLVPLGTVVYTDNGRRGYRYVQFGGSATINPGLLLVAPAAPSNSTGLVLPALNTTAQLSLGSKLLNVTNGATAVTANQFADGQLEVLGANGIEVYSIVGNTADSAGAANIMIELGEGLRNTTALVAGTNTVNLRQSSSLLVVASTTQSLPVGVTIMPVPNVAGLQNYGWVQIAGPAFLQATTATKGYPVVQDTSGTAGYIANTGSNLPQIGIARESAASSLASVFLQLN